MPIAHIAVKSYLNKDLNNEAKALSIIVLSGLLFEMN